MSCSQWRLSGAAALRAVVLGVAGTATVVGYATAHAQTPISGLSPNPDGGNPNDAYAVTACNGAAQRGVVYRNSEAEPHLAVNPLNPLNMIAGWHQDRWSTGGAQSLGAAYTVNGGASWHQVVIPFTRCSGAAPGAGGDYERASDPWISFGPHGTAYYMALVSDDSVNENALVVSRSTDGGVTWSPPTTIVRNPAQDAGGRSLFHDKNTLTADPHDARFVYATWTVFRNGVTSLAFARSGDGGLTWSSPRPVATMGSVAKSQKALFRQGAQIVVLPDGTLVNVFFRLLYEDATGKTTTEQAILRSSDRGQHWTRSDLRITPFASASAFDSERGVPVRDAGGLPSLGINRTSGQLYIAWQDRNANSLQQVGVFVARSDDGGATWSPPVRVNQATSAAVQAFLPTVTVNDQGTVGVLFYDFRFDVPGDAPLSTDVHLSLFSSSLAFLGERRLTNNSFDMRQMVLTGSRGYFPGDYVGMATTGPDFAAAFTSSNPLGLPVLYPQSSDGLFVDSHNRQDIVFVRRSP